MQDLLFLTTFLYYIQWALLYNILYFCFSFNEFPVNLHRHVLSSIQKLCAFSTIAISVVTSLLLYTPWSHGSSVSRAVNYQESITWQIVFQLFNLSGNKFQHTREYLIWARESNKFHSWLPSFLAPSCLIKAKSFFLMACSYCL